MSLIFSTIKGIGDPVNERVVLKTDGETDIGKYILLQTLGDQDAIYATTYASYWFPDQKTQGGDLVVLYSKRGVPKIKDREGGRKVHFYYWGKETAIWNNDSVGAALCKISGHEKFLVTPLLRGDDSDEE